MRYQSPIAQALSDNLNGIANTLAAAPGPADLEAARLKNAYYQSQIDENNQKVKAGNQKLAASSKLGDVVRAALTPQEDARPSPGFVGPMPVMSQDQAFRNALPDLIQYGTDAEITGNLPALNRMIVASGGGSNDATDRAMLGAGAQFADTREGFGINQQGLTDRNAADNARALEVAREVQAGEDRRFHVNTTPGTITTLSPNSPLGVTRIEGNPTPETVKGGIASDFLAGGGDINTKLTPNTPLGEAFGASAEGSAAAPTNLGKLIAERDALPAGSQDRQVYDAAIQNEINKQKSTMSSARNYVTPEGKRGITYDGLHDASTNEALPQGTALSGPRSGSYTEAQTKDGAFALRMDNALSNMAKLPKTFDVAKAGDFLVQDAKIPWTDLTVGNAMISKERQLYNQAAREVLAIFLRKDSGAAVTEQEIKFYSGTYLPMPWDDPQTVKQKLGAINSMRASLIVGSNGSYDDAKRMLADPNFATQIPFAEGGDQGFDPNDPPEDSKVVDGIYYEKHGGTWYQVDEDDQSQTGQ